MSYLNKYKVGTTLFRTLAEIRLQASVLRHACLFDYAPPNRMVSIEDCLAQKETKLRYQKIFEPSSCELSSTTYIPEAIQPMLEKRRKIDFPERFVMKVPNGRVLGDGSTIMPGNALLSNTTTEFHRDIEHHHLLSEKKVRSPERFEGRLAVIGSPGGGNYFHWTLDSIPRFHLLSLSDEPVDAYYVHDGHRFQQEWLRKLDIPPDKIVSASPDRHIEAKELIVPSFAGQPGLPAPDGLAFLSSFRPENITGKGERIYISRSDSKRRRIVNEHHMLPILEKHGFSVIRPGRLSLEEQMAAFAEAKIIIAPHGAELANLVYCQPNTRIVEIFSPYYLNPCFRELAALAGLRHTAFVGQGGSRILHQRKDAHFVWANIRVPTDDFSKHLKIILD